MKYFFHWENHQGVPAAELAAIKEKTKRRAKRYFGGAALLPKHRVIQNTPTEITFAYRRTTGNRVTIRWRIEASAVRKTAKKKEKGGSHAKQ